MLVCYYCTNLLPFCNIQTFFSKKTYEMFVKNKNSITFADVKQFKTTITC